MDAEKQEKMRVKRWKLASELLATETTYVTNINVLLDVFYKPMMEHVKGPEDKRVLTNEDIKQIFGSIKVIQGLNTMLLQTLKDRMNVPPEKQDEVMIGDVFQQFAVYFKSYTTYCHDYEQSLETLRRCRENPDFETFFLSLHNKELIGEQTIKQFLILPVQRIPRYKMLLHELVKSTWETHPDYKNLVDSLEQISNIAQFVEDAQDRFENIKKIVEIQNELRLDKKSTGIKLLEPNRIYLTEINLDVIDSAETMVNSSRQRKFILFNDIFLVCKITLGGSGKDKKKRKENLKIKRFVDFVHVSSISTSSHDNKATLVLTITNPNATLTFLFENEQKRNDWKEHVENCFNEAKHRKLNSSAGSISNNNNNNHSLSSSSNSISHSNGSSPLWNSKASKRKGSKKHNTLSGEEVQVLNPLKQLQLQQEKKIKASQKIAIPSLPTDDLKKSTSLDSLTDLDPKPRKQRSRTLLFSPRENV